LSCSVMGSGVGNRLLTLKPYCDLAIQLINLNGTAEACKTGRALV